MEDTAVSFDDLVTLLEKSAERFGHHPLFGTKAEGVWQWTSCREFLDMVKRCRAGLISLGLKPGDRLAIISANRVEWAVCAYAAMGVGASFVPMYESQNLKDWKFIIEDCGANVLVVSTKKILSQVSGLLDCVPSLHSIVCMEPGAPLDYTDLLTTGLSSEQPRTPDPDDVACIIYTSGTTGVPKGVLLSHDNFASNVSAVRHLYPITTDDRCLSFLPWAHSFGQTCELHLFISYGASIAICESVDKLIDNLAEVQPTVLCAVPRIFNKIYANVNIQMARKPMPIRRLFWSALEAADKRRAGRKLGYFDRLALVAANKLIFSKIRKKFGGRLKYAVSGGAALAKEVAEFIDTLGIAAYEGYGLTETSPIVTCTYPGAHKFGSVGKVIDRVDVVIDTSTNAEVSHDGEIVVYGPNVMKGYHNRAEENAAVFTEDGGFRTGDIGHFDADGFLYITGRIKEQYKLENGKYVVPGPLEEKLKLSPFIANAMVFGDNKPYNVVLLVPDAEAVRQWAVEGGHELSDDWSNEPGLHMLMMRELGKYSADFKGYERARKVALIKEDFTQENGLLTPTLKLKRREVIELYRETIEALYG
ncbi:AMP-dependent synthetase/ligase [Patescibacteria group bacterium]